MGITRKKKKNRKDLFNMQKKIFIIVSTLVLISGLAYGSERNKAAKKTKGATGQRNRHRRSPDPSPWGPKGVKQFIKEITGCQ